MLTKIRIKNFKRLDDVEFELGKSVVLIGPNNSGKTTALQALALWDIGHRLWTAKRGKASPEKRPGVTINRRDLIAIPVPVANLLWHDLHVRKGQRIGEKTTTQNILIEIVVDGVTNGEAWACGLEFDFANEESFYCRPLRVGSSAQVERMPIPEAVSGKRVAFLPPMSGLSAIEPKLETGRINVLVGEGQTAQVLRNMCYQIYDRPAPNPEWQALIAQMVKLFGVKLQPPVYVQERGEITMAYKELSGNIEFDLACAGRGVQQTLLLLSHLYANPGTILLLDEPDAHLEVLRQRQIYQLLTEVAESQGSQIVAASHSEVVLNEAADRDIVIAFVGKPHRIDDRGSQVQKSLKEIGFDQYYLAETTGWVLYLEGSTDLAILRAFAETLGHEAAQVLERPFVHYVANQPADVRKHFWGLRYAWRNLTGVAVFDRLERDFPEDLGARGLMWKKREIENYLCMEEVLLSYARYDLPDDLFGRAEIDRRTLAMKDAIVEVETALKTLRKMDPWSPDTKATDDFLDPLFERYFEKLGLPNLLRKTDYHELARLVTKKLIDKEIVEKLDAIVQVAKAAVKRED